MIPCGHPAELKRRNGIPIQKESGKMQQTFDHFSAWSTSLNGESEETSAQRAALLVDMLQANAGGPRGYSLRRIMLTNFWLYGLQEFEIPHGRLFLLGANASGKCTVLMAALTLQ